MVQQREIMPETRHLANYPGLMRSQILEERTYYHRSTSIICNCILNVIFASTEKCLSSLTSVLLSSHSCPARTSAIFTEQLLSILINMIMCCVVPCDGRGCFSGLLLERGRQRVRDLSLQLKEKLVQWLTAMSPMTSFSCDPLVSSQSTPQVTLHGVCFSLQRMTIL